jgi:hypothetical protein
VIGREYCAADQSVACCSEQCLFRIRLIASKLSGGEEAKMFVGVAGRALNGSPPLWELTQR